MSRKGTRQRRRLLENSSSQEPSLNLAQTDLFQLADELLLFHKIYGDLFTRFEQRYWSLFYINGQLSDLERKSIEPMVLARRGADTAAVRALQDFIGSSPWKDELIIERHQQMVAEDLGEDDGIVIIDGSGFPKQGDHSVGVARQYCGAVGKVANCQEGVFAAYASSLGYTPLDYRLYMPAQWFDQDHEQLREECGVPADLDFKTEPELGLEMLRGLVERGKVPFKWVAADEHYGMNVGFLQAIERLGKWYFVETSKTTRVWEKAPVLEKPGKGPMGRPRTSLRAAGGEPKAIEAGSLAGKLKKRDWHRYVIKEGGKGPIEAEFAFRRTILARRQKPAGEVWVVFRRSRSGELKVFLSNASEGIDRDELVKMSGMRWPVERIFEEGKGELGLDHYETRSWRGWHHHIALTFMSYHFLVRMRLKYKKKPRV